MLKFMEHQSYWSTGDTLIIFMFQLSMAEPVKTHKAPLRSFKEKLHLSHRTQGSLLCSSHCGVGVCVTHLATAVKDSSTFSPDLALVSMKGTPNSCTQKQRKHSVFWCVCVCVCHVRVDTWHSCISFCMRIKCPDADVNLGLKVQF